MKKGLIAALVIAILALIGALVWALCFMVEKVEESSHLVLYGNVDVREVDIAFRVPGQVDKLYFEEGDQVKKGALMTVLDKTPYDSELQRSIAVADSVKANLINAEKLLTRRLKLIHVGGVSQEDLDNAQANYEELKANLHAAQAAVRVAKDNLSYTDVTAPTDGVILTRIREPGSVVNASDPIYTLSVASPVWVRAYVDEPQLGEIAYGMTATVHTDTKGGRVYKGKIGFISPVAEFTPKTVETTELRTDLVYRLRVYVDNPDQFLKQGMPVTVKINLKNQPQRE